VHQRVAESTALAIPVSILQPSVSLSATAHEIFGVASYIA